MADPERGDQRVPGSRVGPGAVRGIAAETGEKARGANRADPGLGAAPVTTAVRLQGAMHALRARIAFALHGEPMA
ncbi:hypothetical protein EMIT047CA2_40009 [Pseudomonas soli]